MTDISRKSLVGFLDTAAQRAETIEAEPATVKQCWFLAGLILDGGHKADIDEFILNASIVLTKQEASRMIDRFMKPHRAH